MSKILNVYRNNLDKAWFNSSNIKFSECQDKEGELKTLDVVFNNSSRYRYKGVDVNDYLMFREAASQGKALNQYIKSKGYEYEKLPNADIGLIEEELNDMSLQTYIIDNSDRFTIYDYLGNIVYENTKLSEEEYSNIANILRSVNVNFKAKRDKMGIVIVSTIGCGKRYLKNIVRDKIKTEDFNVDEGMTVDDVIELIDENDVTFVPYSKDNINFLEENSIDYDLFYPSKSRRIEFLTNAVGKRMKAKDVSDLDKSFDSTVDEIESLELEHGYLHKLDNQGEFLGNYPQLIGYISNIKS